MVYLGDTVGIPRGYLEEILEIPGRYIGDTIEILLGYLRETFKIPSDTLGILWGNLMNSLEIP